MTHTIYYRLLPKTNGYKLNIWEPNEAGNSKSTSFHFMVSYSIQSKDEAQTILNQYQTTNCVCVTRYLSDSSEPEAEEDLLTDSLSIEEFETQFL